MSDSNRVSDGDWQRLTECQPVSDNVWQRLDRVKSIWQCLESVSQCLTMSEQRVSDNVWQCQKLLTVSDSNTASDSDLQCLAVCQPVSDNVWQRLHSVNTVWQCLDSVSQCLTAPWQCQHCLTVSWQCQQCLIMSEQPVSDNAWQCRDSVWLTMSSSDQKCPTVSYPFYERSEDCPKMNHDTDIKRQKLTHNNYTDRAAAAGRRS